MNFMAKFVDELARSSISRLDSRARLTQEGASHCIGGEK
jgi:hypothetical protein